MQLRCINSCLFHGRSLREVILIAILLFTVRSFAQDCEICTPDYCPPCPPPCPDLGQPCTMSAPCTGTGFTFCTPQGEELCACTQDCYCPPTGHYSKGCGFFNGQWDAPKGSLVLIDSGPTTAVGRMVKNLNETYTHEMVSHGPDAASQSEFLTPDHQASCSLPANPQQLAYGYPGMELLNMGSVYVDIFGGDSVHSFDKIVWFLGNDSTRAINISNALLALPQRVDPSRFAAQMHYYYPQFPADAQVTRHLRSGDVSPYSLYQFKNIEGTHYAGPSLRNGSISSTFCAYAYGLAGTPMTPYNYYHSDLRVALDELRAFTFESCARECGDDLACSIFRDYCQATAQGDPCNHAADLVANCTATGTYDSSDPYIWLAIYNDSNERALTISPDRLAGLSDRHTDHPTSWSYDFPHVTQWNTAGVSYGCFE